MIRNILLCAGLLTAIVLFSKNLQARFSPMDVTDVKERHVVELFTSQSCSSCPPADKILAQLSNNPNIITLGFHVTYWNHLHWKDPLSKEFSTQRQRHYARAKGTRRVYTPQMIVDGQSEFTGSNTGKLNAALKNQKPLKRITIEKNKDGATINLPDISAKTQDLWLFGTQKKHTQSIPSGENRGRTVTYSNAVITQTYLGTWNGTEKIMGIDINRAKNINEYIIISQDKNFGTIRAAGTF